MSYVNDEFTLRAKKEGYLARSVYKLKEIDEKVSLFSKGNILDIGAAPGSFSQYAYKKLSAGVLVSVDLLDIDLNYLKKFNFIRGDIYKDDTVQKIKEFAPYAVVISDAAPRTMGNRLVDTSNSFNLSMRVLELALELLEEGGNLLLKVFQGGDELEIFNEFKQNFSIAKKFRPKAVRKNSFEIYFIGKSFLKK